LWLVASLGVYGLSLWQKLFCACHLLSLLSAALPQLIIDGRVLYVYSRDLDRVERYFEGHPLFVSPLSIRDPDRVKRSQDVVPLSIIALL